MLKGSKWGSGMEITDYDKKMHKIKYKYSR